MQFLRRKRPLLPFSFGRDDARRKHDQSFGFQPRVLRQGLDVCRLRMSISFAYGKNVARREGVCFCQLKLVGTQCILILRPSDAKPNCEAFVR